MQNNIHFSDNEFQPENPYVSTFRIINDNSDNKIDSYDGITMDLDDLDEYDIIFTADSVAENNNIVHVRGNIGYSFDPTAIQLLYDIKENKIYIASTYRMMTGNYEIDLFREDFKMSYQKDWSLEIVDNNYQIKEHSITEEYMEITSDSMPYYRFPRSKDGISIPRVIFNIFKIFQDDKAIKPMIMIPIIYNIYRQKVKN
jgi:hypothetical protein